ncbi:PAS domain S-box protein [Azonexus sp.]|uniref:PAS domain-containing hybrid sensor histidine kinase/response regulator n=1 Tax=Azonexus sp. TaxID=1872668 RepID=UPI0035AED0B5
MSQKRGFVAHLEQASPARLLVGFALVLLLSVGAIFGAKLFFTRITDDLHAQLRNEDARLLIGEEIIGGIHRIERDFFQLVATHQPAAFQRQFRTLDATLDKLMHDLQVLQSGGEVVRLLAVNLEGRDQVRQTIRYQRQDKALPPMEVIEIAPLLGQTRDHADHLESLLEKRWQSEDAGNRQAFFATEQDIALFMKQLPPYFERLTENSNRLLVEAFDRRAALQAQIAGTETRLKYLENLLIGLVVIVALAAGAFAAWRIASARSRLSDALLQLATQNARTTTMLDTLSDGVYATDLDGRLLMMNAAGERILGWKNDELVGHEVHQRIHHVRPDGRPFPLEECPLIEVLDQETAIAGEEYFIHRDGRAIPVAYRSSPLYLDGRLAGALVSFQDITEQREREAQLALQRAALEAAANMIMITNRSGAIEYVNPAFCSGTGFERDEILGRTPKILQSGRHDAAFYTAMWSTLLAGRVWEGEIVNRRRDGSLYPERMTVTPILENGAIRHFVAIKWDISAEIETRTRLAMIETAIENINQGVFITTPELSEEGLRIEWVNRGFTRLMGYGRDEMTGRLTSALRSDDTRLDGFRRVLASLAEGRPDSWETRYRRKDGAELEVEVHYAPVRDANGKITHFVALMTDIGARRAAEQALEQARDAAVEASRLKSEFLSTMSHEIRTPMNGVIGMTDLLLDTELSDEQKELATVIRDSGHALLTVINDILDFSKIEAGKIDIEHNTFRLAQVVEGASELLGSQARAKKLSMMVFIDPTLPTHVIGDSVRLRQVLVNLIGNAVKFTAAGEITVRVEALGSDGIRFSVNDTGIGIEPEAQKRLFTAFTQADSSTTRRFGGTGLGLAISRQLVELMGGRIHLDSTPGVGSRFWFTLPLPADPSATADARQAPAMRVLVVDDRETDCRIICHYLEAWRIDCAAAHSGADALRLIAAAEAEGRPYAAIVIDYEMNDMDGIALARRIRTEHDTQLPRLVMITAHDRNQLEDEALAAGFDGLLVKPIRQSHLFDALVPRLPEPPLLTAEAVESPPPQATERGPLILLAEDNPTNRMLAERLLTRHGYVVHSVVNGQEAVEASQTLPIAAILMDCLMPVMDGFEATAAIRRQDLETQRHVPIIAMTANAMEGDRERCLAAGMDDYLSKPINVAQLTATLAHWTRKA